jgi:UDP-N-acetylmuramoyl-L-alanyl-D-glutamate--2,6-diaminopimelate ligase
MAIDEARAGDIVLLAGKGHENYQMLASGTIEFDDREVARRALRERGFGT